METIKFAVFGLTRAAALVGLGLVGCAGDTVTEVPFFNDGTEIILVIDSDFQADEVATIHVSAGAVADSAILDVTGRTDYPISVTIEPTSASRGDIPLGVSAVDSDGQTVISWSAITRFVDGEARYLVAALGRSCIRQQEDCEVDPETGEALDQVCRVGPGPDHVAFCDDRFISPGDLLTDDPGPVFSGPSTPPLRPTCASIEDLPCQPVACPCPLTSTEPMCVRAFWVCDNPSGDVEDARCEIDDSQTVVWSRDGEELDPAACEGDPSVPDPDGEQPKGLICRGSDRPSSGECPMEDE